MFGDQRQLLTYFSYQKLLEEELKKVLLFIDLNVYVTIQSDGVLFILNV